MDFLLFGPMPPGGQINRRFLSVKSREFI